MPPRLKEFLKRWAITTVAVLIAEWIVPGIRSQTWIGVMVATFVLGMLNVVLRPLMIATTVGLLASLNVLLGVRVAILTLPLQIVLFGFLLLAINAALLLAVGAVVPGFEVTGFWTALWGGLVISLVSLFLNSLTGAGNARFTLQRRQRRRGGRNGDGPGSGGPIIDV